MRFICTILLATSISTPALAQNTDFNPYQAVLDQMPQAEAEALIEAAYGPIQARQPGNPEVDGNGEMVFAGGTGQNLTVFLFCDGKLASASAPVTAKVAMDILRPMTTSPDLGKVYPTEDGVTFLLRDGALNVTYWGIGTDASGVGIAYPTHILNNYEGCKGVSK
jgi:hypothetical protein